MTTIKGSCRPQKPTRPIQEDVDSDDEDERPYKTIRTRDREAILPIADDDEEEDEEEGGSGEDTLEDMIDDVEAV